MTLCMKYKILEYNRIDVTEVIDVNRTSASKLRDICHCWYFKDIGFKYEPYLRMVVMVWCKKLWVLMVLLFLTLKEMLAEFIFGIWAKMMQSA